VQHPPAAAGSSGNHKFANNTKLTIYEKEAAGMLQHYVAIKNEHRTGATAKEYRKYLNGESPPMPHASAASMSGHTPQVRMCL